MTSDDKLDVRLILHDSRANETKSCRFLARLRHDAARERMSADPTVQELGRLLNESIWQETDRMPNVPMDPAVARAEIRKMYERAAIDFLKKIGKLENVK